MRARVVGAALGLLAGCLLLLLLLRGWLPDLERPGVHSVEHAPDASRPSTTAIGVREEHGPETRLAVPPERERNATAALGRVLLPDEQPAVGETVEFAPGGPAGPGDGRVWPSADALRAVTDGQGEFQAPLDPRVRYAIRVVPEDPRLAVFELAPGLVDGFLPIRLEVGCTVRGQVTIDGAPAEGCPVRVARDEEFPRWIRAEPRADAGGHYAVPRLPAGAYVVEALPFGAPRAGARVRLESGATQTLDLAIATAGTLRGSLVDAGDRALLAEGEVALAADFRQAEPVAGGLFELRLGEGAAFPITLYARAPGYAHAQLVLSAWPEGELSIALERGYRVRGRVRAQEPPHSWLGGAEVCVAARTPGLSERLNLQRAKTDPEGHFAVDGVAPELEHVVIVRLPGRGTHVRAVSSEPGIAEHDLGTIELAAAAAMSGRVLDSEDQGLADFELRVRRLAPALPDAWRGIEGWLTYAPWTTTSPSGRYRVADLEAGTYQVFAKWPGPQRAWTAMQEVTLESGRELEGVDFLMGRGASLAGRVVGPEGHAVAGALVTLATGGAHWKRVASVGTDKQGAFRFDDVRPGTFVLNVELDLRDDNYEHAGLAGASFDVVSGAEDLELVLGRAASISGFVLDANEELVADAWVLAVVDGYHTIDSTSTDANGAFTLLRVGGVVDLTAVPSRMHPQHGTLVPDTELGHVRLPGIAPGAADVVIRLPYVVER